MSQPTTSIFLNSATPAAPSGFQNVKPQTDGGTPLQSITMYVPNTGGVSVKTANYTAVAGDNGTLLSFNSSSAITLTLPASIPFASWNISVQNVGTGALTVNRNGLNIDGAAANLTVAQNSGVAIFTDSSNYFTERGAAPSGTTITLQHDGTNNGSQTLLNAKSTATIKVSDDGVGGLSWDAVNITAPAIRGTSQYNSGFGSPSSAVIPVPAGAVAGDYAVLFCSAAYNITAVSGWTTIQLQNGNTWNLYAAWKILSSGDISAGSVTVNTAGGFDTSGAMISFSGPTAGMREFQVSAFISAPTTLATSGAVLSTDVGIYWWTDRGTPTLGITPGAGSVIGAYTQSIATSGSGSRSLLEVQAMPGGAQTNSFTGNGDWAIQVIVAGVPTTVGSISGLSGDVTASGSGVVPATVTGLNGTSLAGLATGLLKNTTGTGVPSIAAAADLPVMSASGTGHHGGAVPDPGATAGTTKFLREDGTFAVPPGTGGGSSPTTTKGDLAGFDTASDRIPVGADGTVLTADSTQALGVKWAAGGGGGSVPPAISMGPDWPPGSPSAFDDEFTSGSLNTSLWSHVINGLPNTIQVQESLLGIVCAAHGGDNFTTICQPIPGSTPYTITAKIQVTGFNFNFYYTGLCLQDSSGKTIAFQAENGPAIGINYWNSNTSYNSTPLSGISIGSASMYQRITDDGTNLTFWISADGSNFLQVYSASRTAFLSGPAYMGVFCGSNDGSHPVALGVDWFRKT